MFEDATGVKINYIRGAEAALLGRISVEARANQPSWDIHNATAVNQVPEALQLAYEPPNAKNLMPEARDPKHHWYGVYAGYNVPQYNTNLVKKEDLPKTFEDFLNKPQFAGKLVIESVEREWMEAIFQHYGKEKGKKLLQDIAAQLKPVFVDGHLAMARQIAAGEYAITLTNYSMLTTNIQQQGGATDYFVLDPVQLFFGFVGISAKAPHPNAAKLAANFLLSRQAQEAFAKSGGRVPTRLDVATNPPDVRQRMAEKKAVLILQTADDARESQKVFDEIFKGR